MVLLPQVEEKADAGGMEAAAQAGAVHGQAEYEVLYGGAAGGGKSDALLCEALRQVHIPHYRGLILRKTYPQLSELIDRSREIYRAAFPRARYKRDGALLGVPLRGEDLLRGHAVCEGTASTTRASGMTTSPLTN